MGQSVSECKPCKAADPVTSTVKVDPTLLNSGPLKVQLLHDERDASIEGDEAEHCTVDEMRCLEQACEERERLQAEEELQRREAEQKETQEGAAEAEEARRQAEERQRKEETELAEIAALASQQERECIAAIERQECERREAARAASTRAKEEMDAAKKAVDGFLRKRGFKSLQKPRKAFCGPTVFPLHLAVEEGHLEIVQAMVRCGADKKQKNKAKLSPLELAERRNENHSHDLIVELLRA